MINFWFLFSSGAGICCTVVGSTIQMFDTCVVVY